MISQNTPAPAEPGFPQDDSFVFNFTHPSANEIHFISIGVLDCELFCLGPKGVNSVVLLVVICKGKGCFPCGSKDILFRNIHKLQQFTANKVSQGSPVVLDV